jgi:hypothetical protein
MPKNILKYFVLPFFLFTLFSCASKDAASVSSNESGEIYRARGENDERMITYSISLELSVKNPAETRGILIEQVYNFNGFIVKETENYITARVPAENIEKFLNSAKTLGKTESETKTGTDITDQYRDNNIRLVNLKNVRDKYLALLEKANAVGDILSIEKELERVNTEIEILEGRIKYAEQSIVYSSVTVRFREKAKPGPIGWIFYGLYRGLKWLFILN